MINEQDQKDDGIVIDLGNQNEFEDDIQTNEFEEEDENDFLEDSENQEPPQYNLNDDKVSQNTEASQESGNVLISGNNDAVINAENEKMLFEKLGKNLKFFFFFIFFNLCIIKILALIFYL